MKIYLLYNNNFKIEIIFHRLKLNFQIKKLDKDICLLKVI